MHWRMLAASLASSQPDMSPDVAKHPWGGGGAKSPPVENLPASTGNVSGRARKTL